MGIWVGTTEGEGVDRASLSLPGQQLELMQRAANASATHSVPLVVVLVDGKPTAEPSLQNDASTHTSHAVAPVACW